jgi:hypothetical protein
MSEQLKKFSHTAGIKNEHNHRVRIPFLIQEVSNIHEVERGVNNWNETCAKAIEMFGLPGDKYSCRFTQKAIEFWFLEEKDALLFELCCG